MNKKQLFQKQRLESQIEDNNKCIIDLQKLYDNIINNLNSVNSVNSLNSVNSNNLLTEQILFLENKKKLNKKNINDTIKNISILEQELHSIPDTNIEKLSKEQRIHDDEIDRINNDKIEAINKNIESINNANIEKEDLQKEIDLIKNSIQLQTNIIYNIQIECHSSRKDILNDLKNKKQMKLNVNQHITNFTISNNLLIQKIDDLNIEIENLIIFKKLLVDSEYNINIEENLIKLQNYYIKYNINNDNSLSLNEKLNLIENIIINNTKELNLLLKQKTNSEKDNISLFKENLNIYNKTNKIKVLTYKDKFKIEKEKKQVLDTILENKINLYNNYQTIIIDKLNNSFANNIKELEKDSIKSYERLNITTSRIKLEHDNNKELLKNKLENYKIDLKKLYINIQEDSSNIKLLNETLEKENTINYELSILENKIKKHKGIIIQAEKDLISLTISTNH